MTITGIEVQARREALGLSQTALAGLLNVSQPAAAAWENGTRKVPPGISGELDEFETRLERLTDRMIATAEKMADAGQPPVIAVHRGAGLLSGPVHDTTGPPLPAVLQRVAAARARSILAPDIPVVIVEA